MSRPIQSFILAFTALSITSSTVLAADFRELNHQGIDAMRAGDLAKSEAYFRSALNAYEMEPSRYDLTIKSNLNLLLSKMRNCQDNPPLSGSVSHTHTIADFAGPIFNKEASQRLHSDVQIPMNYAKLTAESASVTKVTYSGEVNQGLIELEARIGDMGNGTYKLIAISSNYFRPTAMQAQKDFSLFKDDEQKKRAVAKKAPPAPPKEETKIPEQPIAEQPPQLPPPAETPPAETPPATTPPDQGSATSQNLAPGVTPEQQAAAAYAVARYQYAQSQGAVPSMPSCR